MKYCSVHGRIYGEKCPYEGCKFPVRQLPFKSKVRYREERRITHKGPVWVYIIKKEDED